MHIFWSLINRIMLDFLIAMPWMMVYLVTATNRDVKKLFDTQLFDYRRYFDCFHVLSGHILVQQK